MSPHRRRRIRGAGLIAAVAATLAPAAASAADFTVTTFADPPPDACAPADCSLREAIIAANAAPGPDRILLTAGT
jgi:CSLREA domain-containing protein